MFLCAASRFKWVGQHARSARDVPSYGATLQHCRWPTCEALSSRLADGPPRKEQEEKGGSPGEGARLWGRRPHSAVLAARAIAGDLVSASLALAEVVGWASGRSTPRVTAHVCLWGLPGTRSPAHIPRAPASTENGARRDEATNR